MNALADAGVTHIFGGHGGQPGHGIAVCGERSFGANGECHLQEFQGQVDLHAQ